MLVPSASCQCASSFSQPCGVCRTRFKLGAPWRLCGAVSSPAMSIRGRDVTLYQDAHVALSTCSMSDSDLDFYTEVPELESRYGPPASCSLPESEPNMPPYVRAPSTPRELIQGLCCSFIQHLIPSYRQQPGIQLYPARKLSSKNSARSMQRWPGSVCPLVFLVSRLVSLLRDHISVSRQTMFEALIGLLSTLSEALQMSLALDSSSWLLARSHRGVQQNGADRNTTAHLWQELLFELSRKPGVVSLGLQFGCLLRFARC